MPHSANDVKILEFSCFMLQWTVNDQGTGY